MVVMHVVVEYENLKLEFNIEAEDGVSFEDASDNMLEHVYQRGGKMHVKFFDPIDKMNRYIDFSGAKSILIYQQPL